MATLEFSQSRQAGLKNTVINRLKSIYNGLAVCNSRNSKPLEHSHDFGLSLDVFFYVEGPRSQPGVLVLDQLQGLMVKLNAMERCSHAGMILLH